MPDTDLTDAIISITEGEFDSIILNQAGIPAVSLPGATSWQSYYGRVFAGFSKIWLFGDPDEAGRQFNSTIQQSMRQARPVRLQADVNDTFLAEGEGYLKELINAE